MKKVYEKPLVTAVRLELPQMVCASPTDQVQRTYKVTDGFEWGATPNTSEFANDAWITEQQTSGSMGGWSISSDENVDVDTRAKGFAW